MSNIKRKRKKRTTSINMCSCGDLHCDSMHKSIAKNKLRKRIELGLCMACGHKECKCKHKSF